MNMYHMTYVGKIIPPTDGNRVLPPGKLFRSWDVVFTCSQKYSKVFFKLYTSIK